MREYQVRRGDTIAEVTKRLHTDWQTLKARNPEAVGRLKKNGHWFLKEGARLRLDCDFAGVLKSEVGKRRPAAPAQPRTQTGGSAGGRFIEHTLQPGETVWELGVRRYHVDVGDIIRDNNIKDARALPVGRKLKIRVPENPGPQRVVASWYGERHHGRPMANGDIYNMYGNTIAHKEIPLGTRVELENPATGEKVRAVVTDRGPYVEGRDVDLSYGLARKLSLVEQGVGTLVMRIL